MPILSRKALVIVEHIKRIEELVPLGSTDMRGDEVRVFLWGHHLSAQELLQIAPSLAGSPTEDYKDLPEKRRVEKLSIQLMINRLYGKTITIGKRPSGRPFLSGSNLEISISHTTGVYALSLSLQRHGIDVEQYSEKAHRSARMFTSKEEISPFKELQTGGEEPLANLYTMIWSGKEALFKYVDQEGLSFREHMNLRPIASSLMKAFINAPHIAEIPHCQVFYKQFPSFILTCCSSSSVISKK